MKVLHIIPGFPTGGAEQVVLSYLQYFKESTEVETVALSLSANKGRIYEQKIKEEGLPVVFRNESSDHSKIQKRMNEIKFIKNYITKFNPDIVHIHLSILWVAAVALIGKTKIKIFYTLHNEPNTILKGRFRYIDWACFKMLNISPICLNDDQKQSAENILWGLECNVLGNGIDVLSYSKTSKQEARELMGVCNDVIVIGHVGRFSKQKNHEFIIEVFHQYIEKHSNAILYLVGDGELKEQVKNQAKKYGIADNIIFAGIRNDIPNIMPGFDVLLFPSIYEGLGISFIEAQAAGVRCVISDQVPLEAVCSNNVARLSLNQELSSWCQAIDGEAQYIKPIRNILDYSIEAICNQLLTIYKK